MTEAQETTPQARLIAGALRLFREELAEVQFPDVDRAALEALVDAADAERRAVEAAHARVREAEAALDAARDALLRMAERALAYARIYAADDGPLRLKIDAVLPERGVAGPPRRERKARPGAAAPTSQPSPGADGGGAVVRADASEEVMSNATASDTPTAGTDVVAGSGEPRRGSAGDAARGAVRRGGGGAAPQLALGRPAP